jgi:regulator of nucleoside diphosphate kinase
LIRLGRGGFSNTAAGYEVIASIERTSEVPTLQSTTLIQSEKSAPISEPTRRQADASAMISAADYQELGAAVAAARKLRAKVGNLRSLQDKLARATIIRRGRVPHDLITMNSQVEVADLASGERLNLTLVYPVEADIRTGRLSVFSSLGAALLGRREGQLCEWRVPYGVRRFRISAVLFQPETALARVA